MASAVAERRKNAKKLTDGSLPADERLTDLPGTSNPGPSHAAVIDNRRDPVNLMAFGDPPPPDSSFDEDGVILIDQLKGDGVTDSDVEKLKNAGFVTLNAVAFTLEKRLLQIKGISEAKAKIILKKAQGKVKMGFTTAKDVFQKRSEIIRITTGSRKFDDLLNSGLETGSLTEVYGKSASGKTQLCYTMAITAQLPVSRGGAEGKVFFIDTQKTFFPERLHPIVERFKLNPTNALDNISVGRAYNTDHLVQLLTQARALMCTERYGLLIIDSILHLYRSDFKGRDELYDRQTHLGNVLRNLRGIADEHRVCVLLTNQVVSIVDSTACYGLDYKSCGGYVLSHATKTRILLKQRRGPTRIAKIENSPCLANDEAVFEITAGGVDDVTEEN